MYSTVVISGGGAKCISAIGVLTHRADRLQNVHTYVGCSGGALLAYLLVIGYHPLDICKYLEHNPILQNIGSIIRSIDMFQFLKTKTGILDYNNVIGSRLVSLARDKCIRPELTFAELYEITKKKLVVCVYSMTTSRIEYMCNETAPDVKCIDALRASASVPVLFPRCFIDGYEYTDGGVLNNFPVHYCRGKSREELGRILAISFNDNSDHGDGTTAPSVTETRKQDHMDYFFRIINIPAKYYSMEHPAAAELAPFEHDHVMVHTQTDSFPSPNVRIPDIIQKGYNASHRHASEQD